MAESKPRPGVASDGSRTSKRVNVSNLDLPPELDERKLKPFERWMLDHPYRSTALFVALCSPFGFAVRHWLMVASVAASLIGAAITSAAVALGYSVLARNQRRRYRRDR